MSALAVTKKCPSMAHSDADCKRSVASSSPSSGPDMALSIPGSGLGSSAIDFTYPKGGGCFTKNDARYGSYL